MQILKGGRNNFLSGCDVRCIFLIERGSPRGREGSPSARIRHLVDCGKRSGVYGTEMGVVLRLLTCLQGRRLRGAKFRQTPPSGVRRLSRGEIPHNIINPYIDVCICTFLSYSPMFPSFSSSTRHKPSSGGRCYGPRKTGDCNPSKS